MNKQWKRTKSKILRNSRKLKLISWRTKTLWPPRLWIWSTSRSLRFRMDDWNSSRICRMQSLRRCCVISWRPVYRRLWVWCWCSGKWPSGLRRRQAIWACWPIRCRSMLNRKLLRACRRRVFFPLPGKRIGWFQQSGTALETDCTPLLPRKFKIGMKR